ncbi:MAG TPA: hypothetical protein VFB32_18300 [Rudaea sp.]|nr:hypothetical protein [Rudaea sp.]
MRTAVSAFVVALACLAATDAPAGEIAAGKYEGAHGDLRISTKGDVTKFAFDVVAENGSTCGPEGEIRNARATLEGQDDACVIDFATDAMGVRVTSNRACSYWCGAGAEFDGLYVAPTSECASGERSATHAAFKHLYEQKAYADARAKLTPLLERCGTLLSPFEAASIRNDLAVTQYHLRDRAGCLATLEPLAKDAAKSDDALLDDYPPDAAKVYLPLVAAARTNFKLCRGLPEK